MKNILQKFVGARTNSNEQNPQQQSAFEAIRKLSISDLQANDLPEEQKLSPREMFALDVPNGERNNYFTCVICLRVVIDPKECQTCNNLFCAGCLLRWENIELFDVNKDEEIVGSKMCPMQCEKPKYGAIHRFSKNELLGKKFRCPNISQGCSVHFELHLKNQPAGQIAPN